MNLITGEVAEIYVAGGLTKGKVKISGAFIDVPLTLLMDVRVGDEIVVSSGVALSKVDSGPGKGENYVLGNPG
jgi:hydrogenase maturation factor